MRAFIRLYLVVLFVWGISVAVYYFVGFRELGEGHHIFVVHGGVGDLSVELHGWSLLLLLLIIVLVPSAALAATAYGFRTLTKGRNT